MITLYLLIFLTTTTTLPYVSLMPYGNRRANTNAAQQMTANVRNGSSNRSVSQLPPQKAPSPNISIPVAISISQLNSKNITSFPGGDGHGDDTLGQHNPTYQRAELDMFGYSK